MVKNSFFPESQFQGGLVFIHFLLRRKWVTQEMWWHFPLRSIWSWSLASCKTSLCTYYSSNQMLSTVIFQTPCPDLFQLPGASQDLQRETATSASAKTDTRQEESQINSRKAVLGLTGEHQCVRMHAHVCVSVCLCVSGHVCEGRLSWRRKWSQRKSVHRDLAISNLWNSRILCHQTVTHSEKSHKTSRVWELVSPLAFFFFFFCHIENRVRLSE